MGEPCRSYRERSTVCADGFLQKPYCRGRVGCFSCGAVSEKALPWCLREKLPDHFVKDDGSTLFYPLALGEAPNA